MRPWPGEKLEVGETQAEAGPGIPPEVLTRPGDILLLVVRQVEQQEQQVGAQQPGHQLEEWGLEVIELPRIGKIVTPWAQGFDEKEARGQLALAYYLEEGQEPGNASQMSEPQQDDRVGGAWIGYEPLRLDEPVGAPCCTKLS